MKLAIQFPTRGRPEKFFEVLDIYKNFAEDWGSIAINVICNADDTSMNCPEVSARLQELNNPNLCIHLENPQTKIAACNWKIGKKEWDIVILVSDDMIPRVQGWDTRIKKDMQNFYPDTDGVLWYNDGHKRNTLLTLSILGRKYFNRFGYLYHPSYKSFFCDNEFMEVAKKLNKVTYISDCIIEHCHPDYKLSRTDALYKFNLRYHQQDLATFKTRAAKNFEV